VLHKMSAIFLRLRLGHLNFPTVIYHLADFFLSFSDAGLRGPSKGDKDKADGEPRGVWLINVDKFPLP